MKIYIKAISYYLPEKTMTNDELVKRFPEWSVEKVSAKVGIHERHIAATNETAGDMAVKAARRLFEEYGIAPNSIDFILLCTQSPDYHLPTTACIIQHKLGIPTTAGALDFNLGCSGYVYGLSLAKGLIAGGIAHNILLLTSETYTKYIHPEDKGNLSIFGDAGTATLVSTDGFAEIGDFSLGTDGSGAENLIVKTGCARHKESINDFNKDEGGYLQASDYLYMNGSEIFNFTLAAVPPLVSDVLMKNALQADEIGLNVFHQANKFMLSTIRKVCGIHQDKFYIDLDKTGNTVSCTLPIALKNAFSEERIRPRMFVVIAGFGVGYSWGATVLKY